MSIRKHESREVWSRRVSAWRASGISGGKFAKQQGLKESTLYAWAQRLGAVGERLRTKAAFAEVVVRAPQTPAPTGTLEVVLVCGRIVRVHGPVDVAQLHAVLETLGPC